MLVGDTFRGTFTAIDSMKVKVSAGAHFGGMTLPRWLWIENEDGNVAWKEGKATTNPTETLDPTELAPGSYTLCMNFTRRSTTPRRATRTTRATMARRSSACSTSSSKNYGAVIERWLR